ncbi:MAG: flagellar motor switch protein FliN [Armatimonadetes bacterium]|nr:flagellar motor switch protein FliN [Armatimonadota bacterium]
MSTNPEEQTTAFMEFQSQLWPEIADALSGQTGVEVAIPTPTVALVSSEELASRISSQAPYLRTTLAENPDESHLFLLQGDGPPTENVLNLMEALVGVRPKEIGEEETGNIGKFFEGFMAAFFASLAENSNVAPAPGPKDIGLDNCAAPVDLLASDDVYWVEIRLQYGKQPITAQLVWVISTSTAHRLMAMPGENSIDLTEELQQNASQTTVSKSFDSNIDLLLDIPLEVTVELGQVEMVIKDILDLGPGSVVELMSSAGEPVEVKVNGRLIARGEVVVVDDNFGVRIVEVASKAERIERMGA